MRKIYIFLNMLSIIMLLSSCGVNSVTASEINCRVEQLLLLESDYPPDTIFEKIHSPLDEEPKESVGQTVYYRDSWISEIAIRYISVSRAQEIFNRREKSIFAPDEVNGSWENLSIFSDKDKTLFEKYKAACGNVISFGNRCFMIGQHQKYFIMYRVDISSNGVTFEMFSDFVKKINDRLSSCVNQ